MKNMPYGFWERQLPNWDSRIRTGECRSQNPVPYPLGDTPLFFSLALVFQLANDHSSYIFSLLSDSMPLPEQFALQDFRAVLAFIVDFFVPDLHSQNPLPAQCIFGYTILPFSHLPVRFSHSAGKDT